MSDFLQRRVVKVTFDATGGKAIATYPLPIVLPNGAIIQKAWYNVTTTFTSATDAATIALTASSAGDIKAAIAISDATNVWDAGLHAGLPGAYAERTVAGDTAVLDAASQAASWILLSANKIPTVAVAVEALTAGVMDIYIEYVI